MGLMVVIAHHQAQRAWDGGPGLATLGYGDYETPTRSTTNTSAAFAGIVGGLPVFP